jgi:4-amino-4-deoxy-L-arabinose transferase-like glycosyltransferase
MLARLGSTPSQEQAIAGVQPAVGCPRGGRIREQAIAVAIVLLGAALRLWRLDEIPGGLQFDEGFNANDILGILDGARPIFFPANFGREPLFIYTQALAVWALGTKLYAVRIAAAAFGLLAVPATYAAVRRLVGGTPALVAAACVATLPWGLISSRVGLRGIAIPALVALGVYFFARALDEQPEAHALRWAAFGAAALSLSMYTYLTGRVTPLIPGLVYGVAALRDPALRRRVLRVGIVGAVVMLLAVAPLATYFASHPQEFWARANVLVVDLDKQTGESGPLQGVARGIVGTIAAFHVVGDPAPDHNVPFRPIFDLPTGLLFVVGLAGALRAARAKRGAAWLLVWLGVGLLPNALTTAGPPNYLRMLLTIPAVAGLVGLGVVWTGARLPAWAGRWFAPIAVVWMTIVGGWVVFVDYATNVDVFEAFGRNRVMALRAAEVEAASGRRVYAAGLDEFDLLARYTVGPVAGRRFSTFDARKSVVVPPPGTPVTYLLLTDWLAAPPELRGFLPAGAAIAFDPAGRPAVEMVRLDAPSVPSLPRPLQLTVADLADLRGFALPGRAEPATELGVLLSFSPRRADARDLAWFADLLDGEGRVILRRDVRGAPSATWEAGEMIVVRLALPVPREVRPGAYHVRVGLYDVATGRRLAMAPVGEWVDLGRVWVAGPETQPPSGLSPPVARFQDGIGAGAYRLERVGREGKLTLAWTPSGAPSRDYTLFVHVLDASGRTVGQADGPPTRPTGTWLAGEPVVDERVVPLPEGAASIRLGFYDLATGQRVGLEGGGDAVMITVP